MNFDNIQLFMGALGIALFVTALFCYAMALFYEAGNKQRRFIKHCCAVLGRAVLRFVGNIPLYLFYVLWVVLGTVACVVFTALVVGACVGLAAVFIFAGPWYAVKRIRKAYKAFQ